MLNDYRNWLINKGYAVTVNNRPSTVYDYVRALKRVAAWESKSVEELAESISEIVQQYTIGIHSVRGRLQSRSIKASVVSFKNFLIETQSA